MTDLHEVAPEVDEARTSARKRIEKRRCFRVLAYVALMRDEYPPFRFDAGGTDPASSPDQATAAGDARLAPSPRRPDRWRTGQRLERSLTVRSWISTGSRWEQAPRWFGSAAAPTKR